MIENDVKLIVIELILAAALYFLATYVNKVKNSIWRLCYLLPGLVAFFMIWFSGYEFSLLPAYVGAVIMAVGFLNEKVSTRKNISLIGALFMVAAVLLCNVNPGYRMRDFVADFEKAFASMKEHYCLTEYKEIDWDALHEKYLPMFQSAKKNHDEVENALAYISFTQEFHDGHVNYSGQSQVMTEAEKRAYGNDYGLSFLLLSDGSVAAANVEAGSEAQAAGIYNGAIVKKWNGKEPGAWLDEVNYNVSPMPDAENDKFYKMICVAGLGEESVSVEFVDKDGVEKQAVLKKRGFYSDRLRQTVEIVNAGMNIGTLSFAKVSEDTVLYRIKGMGYDTNSYMNGDHSAFKAKLRTQLMEQKAAGMKNLILDLRGNGGGSPHMILAMAELLGEEGEHFYCQSAVLNEKTCEFEKDEVTGKYIPVDPIYFTGENLWGHGQIIVLVNGECVSAGDHFTDIMGQMSNVKVVGLTRSNASGQAIRYVEAGDGMITFSAIPALDENGDIYVDTGADRISHVAFDEKIPLTKEAVSRIFDDGEDYVLDYVLGTF